MESINSSIAESEIDNKSVYESKDNIVKEKSSKFWGKLARFCQNTCKLFSKKYKNEITERNEPCVYMCRHLSIVGPLTTLKGISFDVHPLVLSPFFDKEETKKHVREVVLKTKRNGFRVNFLGKFTPSLMKSLQAVPVYRNANPIKTFKVAMEYLEKGESLIIYPDINYKDGYEKDSDVYDGFLFLSVLYKNKTGKDLKFVPLYIDKENRVIKEREDVVILDYKKDFQKAVKQVKERINK